MHSQMKPFRDRNPIILGTIAVTTIAVVVVGTFYYKKLPFISSGTTYSAYFAEIGGLTAGAAVQVSGYRSGQVQSIALKPEGVLVSFRVNSDIRMGSRTEVEIETISLLGNKVLEVTPRGDGHLEGPIPIARTRSPYQLPDAIGDLTATISGLNTEQLSTSLATLSETLRDTPPQLKLAVDGVARFSETLNKRDAHLRALLANARTVTGVLADRTDNIVRLIHDTNAMLVQLRSQSAALDQISGDISALAEQIHGFIAENRSTLKPALDKLNGVLAIVNNRKSEVRESIKGLSSYVMALGESVSSGPFFKSYVANLLPGQFIQPFIDAAFSDLGLDPNVLTPSERTDPQVGQPGTPALPVPFPRTGQGGEPRLHLPDAITGKPGDPRYPYRPPPPPPPPGAPPPGPPSLPPHDQANGSTEFAPNDPAPTMRGEQ